VSKSRHGRRRQVRGAPPARTYVAIVHGIGEASAARWADKSVDRLVRWWKAAERDIAVRELECSPDCALADAAGHRHLALRRGTSERRVDIEPIFWADRAQRPAYLRSVWLAVEVVLLIGLVDLIAASNRMNRRRRRSTSRLTHNMAAMPDHAWGTLGLIARALLVPVLGPPIALALALAPWGNRKVGDAFAWSIDHRGSRAVISGYVRSRVINASARSVVLVGHSQGGSILAELEVRLRGRPGNVRLVTLGTGQALLAAIAQLRSRWRIGRSLGAWLAIFVLGTLMLGMVLRLLSELIPYVAEWVVAVIDFGASFWQHDTTHVPGLRAQYSVRPWNVALADLVDQTASLLPYLLFLFAVAAVVIALCVRLVGDRPVTLAEVVRTNAVGLDIVASRDPIAAAMLELGESARVRRIAQCGALSADHTTYFRNGCSALPLLISEIERAAGWEPGAEDDPTPAAGFHRAGLVVRRVSRPWLVAAVILTTIALGGSDPAGGIVLAGLAAAAASSVLVSLSSLRWLQFATRVAQRPSYAVALERVRRSRQRFLWSSYEM
jgi:hypothetical protein